MGGTSGTASFPVDPDRHGESIRFRVIGTVPEAFDDPEHGLVGLHAMDLPLRERAGWLRLLERPTPQWVAHERLVQVARDSKAKPSRSVKVPTSPWMAIR